jgi:TetR/AcrR family transcriptional regulator, regulator of biofilm formation and stress response
VGAGRGTVITSAKRSSPRRGAIVEATLRVISRVGVDAVTHRAAATEAGVSLASTTYYFDSKDALVQEALELVIDRSTELVRSHTAVDGSVSLDELVERLVSLSSAQLDDRDAPLIAQFELMLEARRRPNLRPLAERWEESYMESITALVNAAGIPEPKQATALITAFLEGSLLSELSLPRDGFVDGHLRPQLRRIVTGLV